jgi:hypothetical protein
MRKLGQAFALVWVALPFSLVLGACQTQADEPARLRSAWKPAKPPTVVLTTGSTPTQPSPDASRAVAPPIGTPEDSADAALRGLRGTLSPEEPRL